MRKQYPRYTSENYASMFGQKETDFIINNWKTHSDGALSKEIGVKHSAIRYYRIDVLGIKRQKGVSYIYSKEGRHSHLSNLDEIFTPEQMEYISDNVAKRSDLFISKKLKCKQNHVRIYRLRVLKFTKQRMIRPMKREKMILFASNELKALEAYNYQGIMKDSVKERITLLKSILNNGNK